MELEYEYELIKDKLLLKIHDHLEWKLQAHFNHYGKLGWQIIKCDWTVNIVDEITYLGGYDREVFITGLLMRVKQ